MGRSGTWELLLLMPGRRVRGMKAMASKRDHPVPVARHQMQCVSGSGGGASEELASIKVGLVTPSPPNALPFGRGLRYAG